MKPIHLGIAVGGLVLGVAIGSFVPLSIGPRVSNPMSDQGCKLLRDEIERLRPQCDAAKQSAARCVQDAGEQGTPVTACAAAQDKLAECVADLASLQNDYLLYCA